jgi:hypothetical protein
MAKTYTKQELINFTIALKPNQRICLLCEEIYSDNRSCQCDNDE